jgi:hypothetical protein
MSQDVVVSNHHDDISSTFAFFSDDAADGSSSAFRLLEPLMFVESADAAPLASTGGFFFFLTIEVKSLTWVDVATDGAAVPSSLSRAAAAMAGADAVGSTGSVFNSST